MSGRIKKAKQKNNYTIVPNAPLKDPKLSWKAKGLLVYLLSMSEDWEVYKKDLSNRSKDGYDSTDSAFKELENAGYIINEGPVRNNEGVFSGNEYTVYTEPQNKTTDGDNPDRNRKGLSDTVNPHLISTTIPYSHSSNKPIKKKLFIPPTFNEVLAYFTEKGYSEESAKRAYDYYEAGQWSDSRGTKIKNWKQKMVGVWFKKENESTSTESGSSLKMVF